MAALPSYKDIIDLVKKGATLEAQEKIMELREASLELQEENILLREQVKELQRRQDLHDKMKFRKPYYWMEGDDVPFCPKCWEENGKAIHLKGDGGHSEFWNCAVCETIYEQFRNS